MFSLFVYTDSIDILLLFSLFINNHSHILTQIILSITKDIPPSDRFFDIVNSNIGLIAGLTASITLIITTVIKGLTWLGKKVTEENRIIREETMKSFKNIETNTINRIEENKQYINGVEKNLNEKITYEFSKVSDKIDNQKDTITEIKMMNEKIDGKLDTINDSVIKNSVRIDGNENRIHTMEGLIYDRISMTKIVELQQNNKIVEKTKKKTLPSSLSSTKKDDNSSSPTNNNNNNINNS
jgi:hypothetical protein